jgi:hypothetical protein
VTSPAQVHANTQNCKHATGPKTPEGRSRSAQNGFKHGLAARVLVPPDEQETYDELLAAWVESVQPADQVERALVQTLARTELTLRRCTAYAEAQVEARRRRAGYDHALAEADRADRLWLRLLSGNDPEPRSILVRALGSFAAGADWLIRRWKDLLVSLKSQGSLSEPEVRRLLLVWGHDPSDELDPVARDLLAVADDPAAADDFERAATTESGRLAEHKTKYLAPLAAAEWAEAVWRVGYDPGPDGQRLARYTAAAQREFDRAKTALLEHRQNPTLLTPGAAPPSPAPASASAPRPEPPAAPLDPRSSLARALPADEAELDLDALDLEAVEAALDLLETERTQFGPAPAPLPAADLPPAPPPAGPDPA